MDQADRVDEEQIKDAKETMNKRKKTKSRRKETKKEPRNRLS